MTFDTMCSQTAAISRRRPAAGQGGVDRFGTEYRTDRFRQPQRTGDVVQTVSCRVSRASGGEQMSERSHDVVQETRKLYVGPAADLREQDTVTVTNADGSVVVADAEVLLVSPAVDGVGLVHHYEARIQVQRQATGRVAGDP